MISYGMSLLARVLPDLVEGYYEGRHIAASTLEESNALPSRTLFPVFKKLSHVGYMTANTQGYILFVDPKNLSIYQVLSAIQRLPYPSCSFKHDEGDENCMICDMMTTSLDSLVMKLQNVTLYEFTENLKRQKKKHNTSFPINQ